VTSISASIAPNFGSRLASFRNSPTMPHMVSLLASLDHASREVWPYQLSGNFFDQGARLADPMLHLPIFCADESFLDR
jgi:hypothetical protein